MCSIEEVDVLEHDADRFDVLMTSPNQSGVARFGALRTNASLYRPAGSGFPVQCLECGFFQDNREA
jgi:hypothetical protein